MIDQERSMPFDKSRPFFGAQMGDYCNSKIIKSQGFIGFDVCNLAARTAAKFKYLFSRFLEGAHFLFLWKPSKNKEFRFLLHKQPIKEFEIITTKMLNTGLCAKEFKELK